MRIYDFPYASNPRKLRVYLKRIAIPTVVVDLASGETHSLEFIAKNPLGTVPVLELDDGGYITESLAIMEYLEELFPEPPMIGERPDERARVRALERFIDTRILCSITRILFNESSLFRDRNQSLEVAAQARSQLPGFLFLINGFPDLRL